MWKVRCIEGKLCDLMPSQTNVYLPELLGKVAPYKQLSGGVEFRESVPKTASGKILRRILRDEARGKK